MVVKKKLTQWYFKITDYADRLLDDLNQLEGAWPRKVHRACSATGSAARSAPTSTSRSRAAPSRSRSSRRAPTRCYGATFMVVAPDSDLAAELVAGAIRRGAGRRSRTTSSRCRRRPRSSARTPTREKTGVFLERYAINPVNGERLPIWAADYVLADYGHGAVMAVPAHDQRDLDFARTFDLPVRVVVDTNAPVTGAIPVIEIDRERRGDPAGRPAAARPGRDRHRAGRRGPHDQLRPARRPEQAQRDHAASSSSSRRPARGRAAKTYRLRDWLISRQRYWGTPDPDHPRRGRRAIVPVPEDQLPRACCRRREGLDLKPKGTSPLGARDGLGATCRPRRRHAGAAATPTRWTPSSTARGTSCAS